VQFRSVLAGILDANTAQRPIGRIVNAALAVLIIANVAGAILESVRSINDAYPNVLFWFEQVSLGIFTIEYLLRLWTAPDIAGGIFAAPVRGRLRFALRPLALIDLASILPAYLGLLVALDFRVLRLLRLLKLTRHSHAFSLLFTIIREERRSFGAILFILALTLIVTASLMYLIENPAQPEVFSSIPAAMWWSIVTLTTLGYGDMVPITPLGKVFGGFVAIIGIGTLALFTGVLSAGFIDELRQRREHYRRMVEASVKDGTMSREASARIERTARELGFSEEEAASIVDEALIDVAGQAPGGQTHAGRRCPHCGKPI
jgi:voltage-gated potassium channel